MNAASLEALIARNAKACEEAAHPTCRCHCGGAMHGKAHSREWVRATARTLAADITLARTKQPSLFPDWEEDGGGCCND